MEVGDSGWGADTIFLTEFHEQRGPVMLWCAPEPGATQPAYSDDYVSAYGESGPCQALSADELRVLMSSVLSVDYRVDLPAPQAFTTDTVVYAKRPSVGDAHLAVHFSLLDVVARGYVRPMALVYLTRDPDKLVRCYDALVRALGEVVTLIKACNRRITLRDIDNRLADNEHTLRLLARGDAAELAEAFAPSGGKPLFSADSLEANTAHLRELRASVERLPDQRIAPDIAAEHGVRLAAAVDAYVLAERAGGPQVVQAIHKMAFDKALRGPGALCTDACIAVAQQRTAAVLRAFSRPPEVEALASTLCGDVLGCHPAFCSTVGDAVAATCFVHIPHDAKLIDTAGGDADLRGNWRPGNSPLARTQAITIRTKSTSLLPRADGSPVDAPPETPFVSPQEPPFSSLPEEPSSLLSRMMLSPRPRTTADGLQRSAPDQPSEQRQHDAGDDASSSSPAAAAAAAAAPASPAAAEAEEAAALSPVGAAAAAPLSKGVPARMKLEQLKIVCADNLWLASSRTPGTNAAHLALERERRRAKQQEKQHAHDEPPTQQQQQQQQQQQEQQEQQQQQQAPEHKPERAQSQPAPSTAAASSAGAAQGQAQRMQSAPKQPASAAAQAQKAQQKADLAHTTLRSFLSVPQMARPLVHSLLRGRPLVVRGASRTAVKCVVRMLAIFVLGESAEAVRPYQERELHLADLAQARLVGVSMERSLVPKPVQCCASVLDISEAGTMKALVAPPCPQPSPFVELVLAAGKTYYDDASYLAHVHEALAFIMTRALMFYHMCCAGASGFVAYPSQEGLLAGIRQQQRKAPKKPGGVRKFFERKRSNSVPAHKLAEAGPGTPAGAAAGGSEQACVTAAELLARELGSREATAQASYSLVPVAPDAREGAADTFFRRMGVADADRAIVRHFAQHFVLKQARHKGSLVCAPPVRFDECACDMFLPPPDSA